MGTFISELMMKKINIYLSLVFLVLIHSSSLLAQNNPGFIAGIDYRVIESEQQEGADEVATALPAQKTKLEFFYWYGCKPCFQVEQELTSFLQQRPDIQIDYIPLVVRIDWRPQAYIDPILAQLPEALKAPDRAEIYQLCLQDCEIFSQYEKIIAWLATKYKTEEALTFKEELIWQSEKNARLRAEKFSISQVPTILINEKYLIDADSAKSKERFIEILDFIITLD